MSKLKEQQIERFCQEYVTNGYKGTKAARAVGKSQASAATMASEWLSNPKILGRVMELQEDLLNDIIMTKQEAIAEMNKLAIFDPRKAFDEEGRLLSVHEMDAVTAAAVKEIEVNPLSGEPTIVKFLDNKRTAIDSMLKHYNAYEDHQKSGAGEMNVYLDDKDAKA